MARGFDTQSNLCPAFAPFMLMLQYPDETSPNLCWLVCCWLDLK